MELSACKMCGEYKIVGYHMPNEDVPADYEGMAVCANCKDHDAFKTNYPNFKEVDYEILDKGFRWSGEAAHKYLPAHILFKEYVDGLGYKVSVDNYPSEGSIILFDILKIKWKVCAIDTPENRSTIIRFQNTKDEFITKSEFKKLIEKYKRLANFA